MSHVLKQQNKNRRGFVKKRGRRRQHHIEITVFDINKIQTVPESWSLSVYLYSGHCREKLWKRNKLEIHKDQTPENSSVYRREIHKIIKCSEKVSQALLFTPSHNTRPGKYSVNSEIEKQQI